MPTNFQPSPRAGAPPGEAPAGAGRIAVVGFATLVLTLVWSHAAAAWLRHLVPGEQPLTARPLTLAALLTAAVGLSTWRSLGRTSGLLVTAATGLGLTLVIQGLVPGSWVSTLVLAPIAAAFTNWGRSALEHLPIALDRGARRRPRLALLWLLVALLAVTQLGRLSTFLTDPEFDWYLSTRNPFWAKHECLPAYLYGAELATRGEENLYHAGHYPALDAEAAPHSHVAGMVVEDPFQYPPPFLLAPRLALVLSDDYASLRSSWFALQTTFFLAISLIVARWIGGRTGRLALLATPAILACFPVLHALQFGQFHLAAVALGLGAMIAFERRRHALGGLCLALATLGKIFPGLLLLPLLAKRRWRSLGWTAGWGLAFTGLALATLGSAPFIAFLEYQWPRLVDGSAFAFADAWPELGELIVADNQGAYGLATKLAALGVPGLDRPEVLLALSRLYGMAVLAFCTFVSLRLVHASRLQQTTAWLAMLGLGSMASTGAFGDYVPLTACWLIALLVATELGRGETARRRWLGFLALCGAFQATLLGTTPLGQWFEPRLLIPLSAVSVLLMFGLYLRTLLLAAADPVASDVAHRVREDDLGPFPSSGWVPLLESDGLGRS